MTKSAANLAPNPLAADLVTFAGLVEAGAQANNHKYPAWNAACGLRDGWNTLASEQGQTLMPELRGKVGEYLAGLGLTIEDAAKLRPPMGVLERLAPTLIKEIDSALPAGNRNPAFVEDVEWDISSVATLVSSRRKKGKAILAGMRWVLGEAKPEAN